MEGRAVHIITSAGGINGTMLARALSHDLPMEALRELWLKNADVDVLLSAEARARRWSKWFLQPLFWAAGATGRFQTITDLEVGYEFPMHVKLSLGANNALNVRPNAPPDILRLSYLATNSAAFATSKYQTEYQINSTTAGNQYGVAAAALGGNNYVASRSLHTGGVNALFCDGHVAFITNSISLTTWQNLAWIADGNVLGDF